MDWYSMTGKSGLIRDLAAKGFSIRKSTKAVNAVFDCMRGALARGESVEVPGGRLRVQIWNGRQRHFLKFRRLKNVNSGKLFYSLIRYRGRRRVIRFDPDLNLNLDHCAAYPPPTIPVAARPVWAEIRKQKEAELSAELSAKSATEETRLLAAQVLNAPVDQYVMAALQAAADANPYHRGDLLQMLRRCCKTGFRAPGVPVLARALTQVGPW